MALTLAPTGNALARPMETQVEYDMDEEDTAWLSMVNERLVGQGEQPVEQSSFEMVMDRLEKESYFKAAKDGTAQAECPYDDDAVCSICSSGDCENANAILFCDACNLAVHQVRRWSNMPTTDRRMATAQERLFPTHQHRRPPKLSLRRSVMVCPLFLKGNGCAAGVCMHPRKMSRVFSARQKVVRLSRQTTAAGRMSAVLHGFPRPSLPTKCFASR